MELSKIEQLKIILREEDIPFFTDTQLNFYLAQNENDLNKTAYECLILKSEDTSLSISGLSTSDTSGYFKRLASRYKPRNTGTLKCEV